MRIYLKFYFSKCTNHSEKSLELFIGLVKQGKNYR